MYQSKGVRELIILLYKTGYKLISIFFYYGLTLQYNLDLLRKKKEVNQIRTNLFGNVISSLIVKQKPLLFPIYPKWQIRYIKIMKI